MLNDLDRGANIRSCLPALSETIDSEHRNTTVRNNILNCFPF